METIEIPPDLLAHVDALSRDTGSTRGDVVRQALLTFLEDAEDARIGDERLRNDNGKRISLDEIRRKYDLVD